MILIIIIRTEKRKTFYLRLLSSVVRNATTPTTVNNNAISTNTNKIVPINYNENGNDNNDTNPFRLSVDSVEKIKGINNNIIIIIIIVITIIIVIIIMTDEARLVLTVPDMSVDLQGIIIIINNNNNIIIIIIFIISLSFSYYYLSCSTSQGTTVREERDH
jgi:hypothetical protein